MNVRLPDGTVLENVPEGTTKADIVAKLKANGRDVPADWLAPAPPGPESFGPSVAEGRAFGSEVAQNVGNLAAGGVRGAGSIGSTIIAANDVMTPGKGPQAALAADRERRAQMDAALTTLGAQPSSAPYQVGKVGAEIAGTAGVGPTLAAGAKVAGASPAVVGAIESGGIAAPGANLATRTAGGAVTGGASAGLVDPEQAVKGGAIGAVLPGGVKLAGAAGKAVGQALKGGGVSPEVAALADRAKQLGIDIPADRLVNSKALDAVASGLNYVPFSGRAATESRMNSQLNQALSKTFGQNSPNVTQALRKAEVDLGGKFDTFLRQNNVNIDQQFLTDLADAGNRAVKELGSEQAGIIQKQIDEIVSKGATGQIDGQTAYNLKKTLDRIGARNSPEAWYALDLKRDLMGALERSVGPTQAAGFKELRQQYGNMLDLQKIAKNGAEGEISVARLANMKNIGNDQMQELADIAAQFVKPREGQHGAMQRAVAGLATAATAGPTGLATLAAGGRLTNMTLNSQPMRNLVMQPQVPLSPQAVQRLSDLMRAVPVAATDQ